MASLPGAPGGPAAPRLPPEVQAGEGERLPARERLRLRADFLRCYRTGRRRQGALSLVYFAPNPHGHPRIGITASRKVGNAVVRHKLKRRIKEIYRRWQDRGRLAGVDLVIHLKPEAGAAEFGCLRDELQGLWNGLIGRRGEGR
ncbi:MAG TPA: ribonuclease P protein component [Thermoanaerobaculia bacterium]|nr:ribonuclease P protein component [Thermoanaerobaculia bacterium]